MLAQVFAISFAYDKLRLSSPAETTNATTCIIQGFLLFIECDTMGMCNIGNKMRVELYGPDDLRSLEGHLNRGKGNFIGLCFV